MSRSNFEFSFEPLRERVTWAVQTLIIVNICVFVGQLLIDIPLGSKVFAGAAMPPPGGPFLLKMLGFQIDGLLGLRLWQPFTYMFLHAGLLHLFMNMLWLYFFGPEVERLLGTRLFFRFYIACGALAILGNFVPFIGGFLFGHGGGSSGTVVGASGATMGVLIAFAMINPERQFFLFPIPVPINARAMVILVIIINVLQALDPSNTTSVWTHFGGMAAGAIMMKFIPRFRGWQNERRQRKASGKGKHDEVGDAVDNIFRFDDRKRNR
jgi:membrane associated rhomboid family serine protease